MARDGAGNYNLPAGNPVVTGTTITSTWANSTMPDIGSALTQSISKDGQTTPTANLPMGGFKHTNVADATARTHYASYGQAQDSTPTYLTGVAGVDTITASVTGLAAYAAGQTFRFISAGANTGAVTLNVNAIGAKAITKQGTTALVAGDIASGVTVTVVYDGTQFQIINITGTVTLTALTAGTVSTTGDATVGTTTANSARTLTVTNTNVGASASAGVTITSDAGSISTSIGSSAAGATASIINSSTGVFNIYTSGATVLQLGTNNTPGRLIISSAGAVNAAVSLSENSTRVFSRNSADAGAIPAAQAYSAANAVYTFAHGLSATPIFVSAWAVCTTAAGSTTGANYAVGDVVFLTNNVSSSMTSVTADATNVYIRVANNIAVVDKTTPSSIVALVVNKWNLEVRAWY